MNYAIELPRVNAKTNLVMEFFSIHKWTALMFGGGLLTVPMLKDLPAEWGFAGFALVGIGVWRQWVEIAHAKEEAKRKQELHDQIMERLRREHLAEWEMAVLRELLGG